MTAHHTSKKVAFVGVRKWPRTSPKVAPHTGKKMARHWSKSGLCIESRPLSQTISFISDK